jgi:polysaccharide biosynthesis/export protein
MVQSGQNSPLAPTHRSSDVTRAKGSAFGLWWQVRTGVLLCAAVSMGLVAGCENDSYMSPSVGLGRFEHTPSTAPILDRLAAVEGPAEGSAAASSEILPEDLIPEVDAYRLGAGDQLVIDIADVIVPDRLERYERVVDPRGFIDLPKVPSIYVDGLNAEEVKSVVVEAFRAKGILTNTTVDVNITQRRRLTYNVIGGVTNPGTYSIPRPEFRLLEALGQAGRFNESVQSVYVIRGVPLSDRAAGRFRPQMNDQDGNRIQPPPVGNDPLMIPAPAPAPGSVSSDQLPVPAKRESVVDLIDSLGQPGGQPAQPVQPQQQPANPGMAPAIAPSLYPAVAPAMLPARRQPTVDNRAPAPVIDIDAVNRAPAQTAQQAQQMQQAMPAPSNSQFYRSPNASRWQFIDGQWINTMGTVQDTSNITTTTGPGQAMGVPQPRRSANGSGAAEGVLRQRVIKVPMAALLNGSPQYNIVIRPFDIVRVPSQNEGQVFVEGQVQRPGVYNFPAYGGFTLTRAIVAAGGLNEIAIPERVDITRFIGSDRQATVRLNLRAIKENTHPDIHLREGDLINVGTNFWAFPLSIIRQGFRFTYGFGFSMDRNFGFDVFGPLQTTDL